MKKLRELSIEELKEYRQELVNQQYGRDLVWHDKSWMVESIIKEKEEETETNN